MARFYDSAMFTRSARFRRAKRLSEATGHRGRHGLTKFGFALSMALVMIVSCAAPLARGGMMVIDDFSEPTSPSVFVLTLTDPTSLLVKQSGGGILGGERDVLIDVQGPGSPISAAVSIGGGSFVFSSSSPGSIVTLQYDGSGAGDVDSSTELFNNGGLLLDLMMADHFALDFPVFGRRARFGRRGN